MSETPPQFAPAPVVEPDGGPAVAPTAPVAPIPAPRPKGSSGRATNLLLVAGLLVAVGGVTFAIGRATAPSAAAVTSSAGQGFVPGGSFAPGAGFQGGMPAGMPGGVGDRALVMTGTVVSADGSTLVIETADGTQRSIDVSASTYHAQADASATDVAAGSTVAVTVEGFGPGRMPTASGAPGASAAPATGTLTATDVTITGE